jgi:hypothetical protein
LVRSWREYFAENTYQRKVLDRLRVKSAAVLKYNLDQKVGAKYDRKVSLNKPPSGELGDSCSEEAEASDSEESSSSIESAASLLPRKVFFDASSPVSHPPSIIMSSAPFNGAAPPGSGKLLYCLFVLFVCFVSYYYYLY